jgi:transposase
MNEALAKMDERFSAMYEADVKGGRPSIAPEKLMRAMLLQVLYSGRSERQLVEQINYNLLFRWFVGLSIEDSVLNHFVFSKNRDRMIEHDVVMSITDSGIAALYGSSGHRSRESFKRSAIGFSTAC